MYLTVTFLIRIILSLVEASLIKSYLSISSCEIPSYHFALNLLNDAVSIPKNATARYVGSHSNHSNHYEKLLRKMRGLFFRFENRMDVIEKSQLFLTWAYFITLVIEWNWNSRVELQHEYKQVMKALREPISHIKLLLNPQIQLEAVVAAKL